MVWPNVVVASGSVRLRPGRGPAGQVFAVLAGGDIELDGSFVGLLLVSGGNVNLKESTSLSKSVVIARGKVICTESDVILMDSRIISGKSVYNKKRPNRNCIITENEPNPLGYIRWSELQKEKPAPKSK
jgi:hypothetical protein